jgi:hypothetical protein
MGIDPNRANWRTSSFTDTDNCFELADLGDNLIGLRDTKDQGSGPILHLTRQQMAGLIAGIKAGEFDDLT